MLCATKENPDLSGSSNVCDQRKLYNNIYSSLLGDDRQYCTYFTCKIQSSRVYKINSCSITSKYHVQDNPLPQVLMKAFQMDEAVLYTITIQFLCVQDIIFADISEKFEKNFCIC